MRLRQKYKSLVIEESRTRRIPFQIGRQKDSCCILKFPRPFHDSAICHQRCHRICSASSGTEAFAWWGMIRGV
jgi:hypothetical protein